MDTKPIQKMESNKKLDYDSDIIICDDIPEIILVPSSPDKKKKAKTKKHKRKVKRGVNYNNNMETLLITQKLPGKKTNFKCVININTINTVCEDRKCDSIVRYEQNVCKKEAYHHRILPICTRNTCFDEKVLSSCCRSTESKKYKMEVKAKTERFSPVSSISYEDVSNGNFSSASDEELETLIKRAKLRENKIGHLYSTPEYVSVSTPPSKFEDISRISSPFSVDTNKSVHSDTTLVLNPLSSEAYSPTASVDYIKLENFDNLERFTLKADDGINSVDVPYSPTMTPDLIKAEVTSTVSDEDAISYSPTFASPDYIKLENFDNLERFTLKADDGINSVDVPYSPTMTPDLIKAEVTSTVSDEDAIPYSPTFTPESMKLEKTGYDSIMNHNSQGNMRAPYSLNPSELVDNKKFDLTLIGGINNTQYSPTVTSNLVKRRKYSDVSPNTQYSPTVTSNLIKRRKYSNVSPNTQYSPTVTSNLVKRRKYSNVSPNTQYSPTVTSNLIKSRQYSNVSPNTQYSPTVTSNLIKSRQYSNICPSNLIYVNISDNQTTKMKNANDPNVTRSPVKTSNHIKVETIDNVSKMIKSNNSTMIKREKVQNSVTSNGPFSAIHNKIHIKSEGNDDHKWEKLVKKEKD